MAVTSVSANPGAHSNSVSAYGNVGWAMSASSAVMARPIPAGDGSAWCVWQVGVSGLPPGQAITGIRLSGSIAFYVGTMTGVVRTATAYVNMFKTFAEFSGANSNNPMATIAGDGNPTNLDYTFKKGGFTSTDLANGNVFVGIAVSTINADTTRGDGQYSFGALNWTIYTAPDDPAPPAGSITSKLINPTPNTNPGVFTGGQFAQVTLQLLTPLPQSGYSSRFDLPYQSGLTFASNGLTGLNLQSGTVSNPTDPYRAYSGLLNIAAKTKPGVYSIYGTVSGLSGVGSGPTSQQIFSQLTVRSRSGMMFTEA
jgi:hypothetical protein